MGGLKTISMTRRNGRGPDSSLKRLWVSVWIHVYTVVALWIVTHCRIRCGAEWRECGVEFPWGGNLNSRRRRPPVHTAWGTRHGTAVLGCCDWCGITRTYSRGEDDHSRFPVLRVFQPQGRLRLSGRLLASRSLLFQSISLDIQHVSPIPILHATPERQTRPLQG